MKSTIVVQMTEEVAPTAKQTGVMQTGGLITNAPWPAPVKVFIRNGEQPLKPGLYATQNLQVEQGNVIGKLFANELQPIPSK